MVHLGVLNYMPRVPSCLTYLTCLTWSRACVPFFLHAFLLCVSYVPLFFDVPYVAVFLRALRAFLFYVPHVLSFFACLHFLRALSAFIFFGALRELIFLRALRAFTFLSVSNFWRALCVFTFL